MNTPVAEAAGTFGVGHIALTAAITAALALAAAVWRLPRAMLIDQLAVGVIAFAAVLLWRLSANMPELNNDGLPGFSANDWLAPLLTYITLAGYADLRAPADPRRFAQARALATIAALAVNVVTI
ncbi:hypothetical protein SAMN05661080_05143 [Modestobacter sp. DSM 44400]|uniref:hypothetical protein n=1 Tax=Modestobacter sp. DSM 44400 TaxID=1550230 RepID=UPI00089809AB|nr:hypothetical protein [Modestobacter sp. DSM 44400]SDY96156.1 hypothetical protein SAMN05661080_05143 [Modestobacter sp. DSM 44400]